MKPTKPLLVLDTNILVRVIRGDTVGQRVTEEYDIASRPERPIISIVTAGEIRSLARKLGWGDRKRAALAELLRQLVVVDLRQGDILGRYAEIDHFCEKVVKPARTIQQNDMWIAATAGAVDATLITTDGDFDHLDGRFLEVLRIDSTSGAAVL